MMAIIPSAESVLLEVLQALGLDELQTKTKTKFKKRQMALTNHQEKAIEIFQDICREIDLDLEAQEDLFRGVLEAWNFQIELENSVWTFGADQRQVLWYILGYTWMPFLGRKAAFWQLDEVMDANMSGGEFWYLPRPRQTGEISTLQMPVATVLDWLLDLTGLSSLDRLADYLGGGYNEKTGADEETASGIASNLYKWQEGKLPRAKTIDLIFRDGCKVPFKKTFHIDTNLDTAEKLKKVRWFLDDKALSPNDLRNEIPLTTQGAIEGILEGKASDKLTKHFIDLLLVRYAPPTMQMIRKRLHLARAVQHGYRKLLKVLCPKADDSCADPATNKVLQLLQIYKYVYNLTIQASGECSSIVEEDQWFESNLPPWHRAELFCSILPSLKSEGEKQVRMVGENLSKRFMNLIAGDEIEDLFGWDASSEKEISKREMLRLQVDVYRSEESQKLQQRILTGSPWRTLQTIEDYWITFPLMDLRLPSRVTTMVINRLREIASTPVQEVFVILKEIDLHINNVTGRRDKTTCLQVERLIRELESHPAIKIFRSELLRHKAKHALLQNDFDMAADLFRQALVACEERNIGPQRGEIARDLLALSVATQPFVRENQEKYFRLAVLGGIFNHNAPDKFSMEDAAVAAADYFWGDMYKPYPGNKPIVPPSKEQAEKYVRNFMHICADADWGGLKDWAKTNSYLKDKRIRDVRGDTFINLFLKFTYEMRTRMAPLQKLLPPTQKEPHVRFEAHSKNTLQALKLLASIWPKQLNLVDFKGQSPLMIAASNNDHEMIEAFLMAGADPNLQDYKGRSALTAAIAIRSVECTKILLENGANLSLKTIDGNSSLHTAIRFGHPEIATLIRDSCPGLVEVKNDDGQTPLDLLKTILEDFLRFQSLMAAENRYTGSINDFIQIKGILFS